MGWFLRRKPDLLVLEPQVGDIEAMADIHARSFSRAWNAADIRRLLDAKGVISVVARAEGAGREPPFGFAIAREAADEAEIITIATDPSHRRCGAAKALMRDIIRRLHGDRIMRLFLEVSEDNAPAIALYRNLGFRQVGLRKGYYGSASMPGNGATLERRPAPAALVMELDLG